MNTETVKYKRFFFFSNVISVGDRMATVPPQHTREEPLQEQRQQTAGSTQILILLPDGNQRLVNLNVPQGTCSLEEIFEQVRKSKFAHIWRVFRILAGKPAVLVEVFCGFPQSLQTGNTLSNCSLWVGCFISLIQHLAGCRVREVVLALASCRSFCIHKRVM